MKFNRLKQLGNDTLIYGIGGFLTKSLSFFLLPIYTRVFTPAEYGTLEMLTVIGSLLGAIMVLGMDSAQSMYFFKMKENARVQRARLISSILQWRLIWGLFVILIATTTVPILNSAFFSGNLSLSDLAIVFVGALFLQVMNQSVEVLRLLYRPWSYICLSMLHSVLAAATILILILVFQKGIVGFFLGTAIASLLVASCGWFILREYITFDRIHYGLWPKLVRFGAPLLPAGLAMYVMNTADRWFILYYHGEDNLGLFAIGAKFAMLLALIVEIFRKAWWPIAMDAMQSDDGPETFRLISKVYVSLGICSIIVLTLLSPWLIRWIVASQFYSAWPLVGILAWQAFFYGFFSIASAGIWRSEKTYMNFYIMSICCILGLLLNWLLVPDFGGVGAAIATNITFLVWIGASIFASEKYWPINLPIKQYFLQVLVGSILVAWLTLTDVNSNLIIKWCLALISCGAFLIYNLHYELLHNVRRLLK